MRLRKDMENKTQRADHIIYKKDQEFQLLRPDDS